jgi:hypothetical protein
VKIILFECSVLVKVGCNVYHYFAELAIILLTVIIDVIVSVVSCKFSLDLL